MTQKEFYAIKDRYIEINKYKYYTNIIAFYLRNFVGDVEIKLITLHNIFTEIVLG